MAFLIKIAASFLFIAVAGGFLINQVPTWKQRVIEVINPAAKEARILGELASSLDELDSAFNSGSEDSTEKSRDLLAKSRSLVNELTTSNDKNSGIIKQQVGKIIDALIDRTPYPADHLTPITTPITDESGQLICPPVE